MDKGANRPNDATGAWDEDDSKIFVEFGRAMVPGREEIERALLDLIPAQAHEPLSAVEIGTGSGWLSAAVLREFPKARILGLDGSPQMLKEAAQLLGQYAERAELRRAAPSCADSAWKMPPGWRGCRRRRCESS